MHGACWWHRSRGKRARHVNRSPSRVIPHGAACRGRWEEEPAPSFPVPGELLLAAWRTDAPRQDF